MSGEAPSTRDEPRSIGSAAFGLALVIHILFVMALPASRAAVHRPIEEVSFEVYQAPEPAPEPTPEPEPEPESEPEAEPVVIRPTRVRVPPPTTPQPQTEAPPPEDAPPPPPPADFTGLVLSSADGNSDFVVMQGTGRESDEPLAPPVPGGREGGEVGGVPGGVVGGTGTTPGPTLVPVGNLSRAPVQPSGIQDALTRNYPARARSQGVSGRAVARIRVNPDGSSRILRITNTNPPGYDFDRACRRSLQGLNWQTPLGPNGQPVATTIQFNCDFRVQGN